MAPEALDVRTLKQRLRREIKHRLQGLQTGATLSQSLSVEEKLLQFSEYQTASRLSVYLSMPQGEVITRDIVVDALNNKKRVFVPHVYGSKGSSQIAMLALESIDDYESLEPDAWGIPSLAAESIASRENALGGYGVDGLGKTSTVDGSGLDLIVMPGMAFDVEGRRLGHGKGYYDRYLHQYRETFQSNGSTTKMPRLVGLALREQLLPPGQSVPIDQSDWTLDRIVSSDVE